MDKFLQVFHCVVIYEGMVPTGLLEASCDHRSETQSLWWWD